MFVYLFTMFDICIFILHLSLDLFILVFLHFFYLLFSIYV